MKTLGMLLNEAFANDKQMKAAIYKLLKPELSKRFKDESFNRGNIASTLASEMQAEMPPLFRFMLKFSSVSFGDRFFNKGATSSSR